MSGTVSNLLPAKAYGFITGEDDQEYFFHKEEMASDWNDLVQKFSSDGGGRIKVFFEPTKGRKGLRAVQVTVV